MIVDFVPQNPSHAEEISERILRLWLEIYCGEIASGADGIRAIHAQEETADHVRRYMSEGTVYEVVTLDGDDVGLVAYRVNGSDLYLNKLYIEDGYRGIGLGTVCLEHVFDVAREKGCASVSLVASRGNKPAFAFYTKFGFEIVGVVEITDGLGNRGHREQMRKLL